MEKMGQIVRKKKKGRPVKADPIGRRIGEAEPPKRYLRPNEGMSNTSSISTITSMTTRSSRTTMRTSGGGRRSSSSCSSCRMTRTTASSRLLHKQLLPEPHPRSNSRNKEP
ncbi:hypothetical protein Fot_27688 [Forsythia ovata]|uniref:Uncharacterized protein n=1 Tax=Forsythia ovata TaxID=205694 RepID=A0ABD1TLV4_9LAMI